LIEEKLPYRWWMLLSLLLVSLFGASICMAVMPALFGEIQDDLGLSHAQTGIIWGSFSLGGLLTSFAGGMLGDRYGIKRIIAAGLFFTSISCALRAVLPGYAGLTSAMLLFGMSQGLVQPNLQKAVGQWFGPRELGMAMGAIIVGGAFGFAVSLMTGAAISSAIGGWKNVMWLTSAIAIGTLVMWMVLARERSAAAVHVREEGMSTRDGLRMIFRLKDLWIVSLMFLCVQGSAMAAVGLLPETLEDRGMTASMAGIFVSISTWVVMMFNIIGPYFSDRLGTRKLFIWPGLLISTATVTLLGVFTGAPLIIVIVLYSIGLGVVLPMLGVLIIENERIGSAMAGSAIGVVVTMGMLGAVVIPILMGAIMDATGRFWPGFLLLAVLLTFAVVLTLKTSETGLRARRAGPAGR